MSEITPLDRIINSKAKFPLPSFSPFSHTSIVVMISLIGVVLSANFWYENAFLAFTGLIVAVSAYTILKPDPIFPGPADPSGKPEDWTLGEMRKWLNLRGLEPANGATREELLERIKLNIRMPRNVRATR